MERASETLVEDSEQVLRKHARSFRWAAPFLPRDARRDAAVTYAFCRFLDDVVDERSSDESALRVLDEVEAELCGTRPARPLVAAYREIEARRGIPKEAARDLLAGMRSDMNEVQIADDGELDLYCHRVAGVVGLMMAPILGTRAAKAMTHARDLGMAMQLTNICRDVAEDARRHRVYLPADRLLAAGTSPKAVLDASVPPSAVLTPVRDLLERAEALYQSGRDGLAWLPFRARVAIAIAARLYRAIGLRVLAVGTRSLERRTVVSPLRKLGWVVVAMADALLPGRASRKELPAAS